MKSANGLPANRESDLRECMALIRAGQNALNMQNGVTIAQLEAYRRQAEFLSRAAHDRYNDYFPAMIRGFP